ncbi:MAG: ATP-binding protein [Desulfurococcales archaeon]|nr:ATP-binding protein [Desulfurococcales archaeon]
MISRGVQVLEKAVRNHVLAAMKAEKRGDYEVALYNMKKAVEILENLIRNYPDHPLISLYMKSLKQYKAKIKHLEGKLLPANGPDEEYRVEIQGEGKSDVPPEFVLKEKPNITFDDIAGLDDAKEAIREAIIYPIKRPDLFPIEWPRGILLYGPPGTGKTMLGAAVANEVNGEFLYVSAANIMSKWLGEGEKNVKRLFDYARRRAEQGIPVIIFIDEIDDLFGVHSSEVGGEVRVRNHFLKEMDGLLDKGKKLHIYVIGATNKPWKLDEAFIRRFQKRIYVPLPDRRARKRLLEMLTSKIKLAPDVDLDELADMLEGYNGSDIKDIVFDAYMRTVKEFFKNGSDSDSPRPVTMDDFRDVIRKRKPSVDPENLKALENWRKRFNAV